MQLLPINGRKEYLAALNQPKFHQCLPANKPSSFPYLPGASMSADDHQMSTRTAIAVQQVGPTQQVAEGLSLDRTGSDAQPETRWPSWAQMERIRQESRLGALVGQNVVLNCAVQFKDGIEKPFVVNWLKYPHKQPIYIWYAGYPPFVAQGYESRVSRIGHASLNLTQVRESDQGLYECKIYYLDRRPEDKGNGTWIYLDVQGECVQLTY